MVYYFMSCVGLVRVTNLQRVKKENRTFIMAQLIYPDGKTAETELHLLAHLRICLLDFPEGAVRYSPKAEAN